eukprot:1160936-Pelagomonas_calceolata.AAC.4
MHRVSIFCLLLGLVRCKNTEFHLETLIDHLLALGPGAVQEHRVSFTNTFRSPACSWARCSAANSSRCSFCSAPVSAYQLCSSGCRVVVMRGKANTSGNSRTSLSTSRLRSPVSMKGDRGTVVEMP